jgi:hypothetical protein
MSAPVRGVPLVKDQRTSGATRPRDSGLSNLEQAGYVPVRSNDHLDEVSIR